jgi:hypothetical protein
MIKHELKSAEGILIVSPEGRLEASDFESLAQEIDPYLEAQGHLTGLMIVSEAFPRWSDFGALVSHLKFVRAHHEKIKKVAAVTDSKFVAVMPRVVDHFISAEVKHFDFADSEAALEWLRNGETE